MKKKVLRISCCALIFAILLLSTPLALYAAKCVENYSQSSAVFYTCTGNVYHMYEHDHSMCSNEDIGVDVYESLPGVTKVGEKTGFYNCHSYAWFLQDTSNQYWMNLDGLSIVMADPRIVLVDTEDVQVGDIVVYWVERYGAPDNGYDNDDIPSHSGVVTTVMADGIHEITSKWGMDGLYKHPLTVVPTVYLKLLNPTTNQRAVSVLYFRINHLEESTYSYIDQEIHSINCSGCNRIKGTDSHTVTGDASQYDSVYHRGVCSVCNHENSLDSHNFQYLSNGFKPTQPSSTHTKTCTDCNASYTEGHTFSSQANGNHKCIYCGYITTTIGPGIASTEDEFYKS